MGRAVLNALVGLLLFAAFLLPYAGGAVTAYVLIALSLVLILWNFVAPPAVQFDLGAWFFLGAFSLLATAFMLTNLPGRTDFLFAVNFAMFALYPLLNAALQRFAGPPNGTRVATLALAGSFVALGIGIVEKVVFNFNRTTGFAANPIPSSTVALLLGFIALMGMFSIRDWRRYIYLLGPCAGIGTVLLASSRGPLLAVPVLVLISLVMVPIRRIISVGVVAGLSVCAAVVFVVRPETFGRLAALPAIIADILAGRPIPWDVDASGSIRYAILEGSILAFQKAPWLGYGWYFKVPVVAKYMPWDVGFGEPLRAHLHSDILNFGVSAGIVGLTAYVLVLIAPIASAAYGPRDSQYWGRLYGTLILSSGYAVCGAVNLLFGFEFMTTMYVILSAVLLGYCRDSAPAQAVRTAHREATG